MKTLSNVYLLGFSVTLCIIIIDSTALSTFRNRPRSTRGFKNAALSTARGFGKRDGFIRISEAPMDHPFGLKKDAKEDANNLPVPQRRMMKLAFLLLLVVSYSLQSPVDYEDTADIESEWSTDTEVTDWTTETEETTWTSAGTEEPESYPNGKCPETDGPTPVYLADMRNCSVFYQCSNGVPYRMTCTFPLEFNLRLKVCDFPGLSGCVVDKIQPFRMIGRCPPKMRPGMVRLLRDSEDQTIYYECVDGEPILRKCPEGTVFQFVKKSCQPTEE